MRRALPSGIAITVTVVTILIGGACNKIGNQSGNSNTTSRQRVSFGSVGNIGLGDPAPFKDPTSSKIWMTYSSVEAVSGATSTYVNTRLSESTDSGSSWSDDGLINSASENPSRSTATVYEVSKIFYDPYDSGSQKWHLLYHRYERSAGDVPDFQWGWIGHKTASSPLPLTNWSSEQKLFSGSAYDSATMDSVGGAPLNPITTLNAGLSYCQVLTEPGATVTSSAIYVTLVCVNGAHSNDQVLLLKENRSNGTWSYLGSLLTGADAAHFGYRDFSGSDLFQYGGSSYLIVSGEDTSNVYHGCDVFQVSNLDSATLARDGSGYPVSLKNIQGTSTNFNGACGYEPSAVSGIMYHEYVTGQSPLAQIFMSFVLFP